MRRQRQPQLFARSHGHHDGNGCGSHLEGLFTCRRRDRFDKKHGYGDEWMGVRRECARGRVVNARMQRSCRWVRWQHTRRRVIICPHVRREGSVCTKWSRAMVCVGCGERWRLLPKHDDDKKKETRVKDIRSSQQQELHAAAASDNQAGRVTGSTGGLSSHRSTSTCFMPKKGIVLSGAGVLLSDNFYIYLFYAFMPKTCIVLSGAGVLLGDNSSLAPSLRPSFHPYIPASTTSPNAVHFTSI